MTRERGSKIMEYLHATLFFAMFVPLVYAVPEWSDPGGTGALYLKCLLIAVPIIVTERAAGKVRSVVLYFLISILLLAGMAGATGAAVFLAGGKGVLEGYEICYCVLMLAETFFVIVKRFADRVSAAKRKREEPLAARYVSFLEHPTLSLVWYFVVLYLLGLLLNAQPLCDTAFYSAIAYTFLALFYEYFGATGAYLEMNRRTRGIPRRRLYGVSFSMLLIFAVLLSAGMLPAALLAGQRQYTDIREWFDGVEIMPYEYEADNGFPLPPAGGEDWMELLDDGKPAPEPSKIAMAVLWGIGAVCALTFLCGVVMLIRQILRDFRDSSDENGDRIEDIEEDQGLRQRESIAGRRGRRGVDSEAERIRRRYRQMIQKHRKERPAPHESPAEIEENAGLINDEQMQQLHRRYEEVRYGKRKNEEYPANGLHKTGN